jgi:hypothetical protein
VAAHADAASLCAVGAALQNVVVVRPWGVRKAGPAFRCQRISRQAAIPGAVSYQSCTAGYPDLIGFADALVSVVTDGIRTRSDWPDGLRDEIAPRQLEVDLPLFGATRSPVQRGVTTSAAGRCG